MKSDKTNHKELVDSQLSQIGDKVRVIRKNQYKNYEDFAKAHKLNKVTVSRLEKGDNVTLKTLVEVLSALGVSINDFFKEL